jgi:hypothetical protein
LAKASPPPAPFAGRFFCLPFFFFRPVFSSHSVFFAALFFLPPPLAASSCRFVLLLACAFSLPSSSLGFLP